MVFDQLRQADEGWRYWVVAYYDMTTGQTREIGQGREPNISGNTILYRQQGPALTGISLVYYLIDTGLGDAYSYSIHNNKVLAGIEKLSNVVDRIVRRPPFLVPSLARSRL